MNRKAKSTGYGAVLCVFFLLHGCGERPADSADDVPGALTATLAAIGLDESGLSVPRLDGLVVTPQGRLAPVDVAMQRPLGMIDLSRALADIEPDGAYARYLSQLFAALDMAQALAGGAEAPGAPVSADAKPSGLPALDSLLAALAAAQAAWPGAQGAPETSAWDAVLQDLAASVSSGARDPAPHRLSLDAYHALGRDADPEAGAAALLRLLDAVENALPDLRTLPDDALPLEQDTPLGRLRLAGRGADRHAGSYALLIDLGGDDHYDDVGQALAPGQVALVVDLDGNDTVTWQRNPGPGAGVLGTALWLDLAGNDSYRGSNLGLGVGIFGSGLFLDLQGDDRYSGGSRVLGAGQYGVGVMLDAAGNDRYDAALNSQGYGGSGGYGIQVDLRGDDAYACNPLVPDQVEARNQRHGGTHYLSLCQGYGFGRRQQVSGGVGLLLDRAGNDSYRADLFAQGGAYWFALGMLVDRAGDDRYEAFEHCQGESLHLGAGLLGDWDGNDEYIGYEHCQGVGIDRAVGVLYDHRGDDRYRSHHESQGAGLKPFGVGLLIEAAGDDHYQASETSQGYSARPPAPFPESQWPLGVLLDLRGADGFEQPGVAPPDARGRVQNRQGVAADR